MKKLLLLGIAILLVANVVSAAPYPYMALYLDENRSSYCAYGDGPITIYVFVLPSDNGAFASELRVELTGNIWPGSWTTNSEVVGLTMGDISSGMSFSYNNCETDWHYVGTQGVFLTDDVTPGGATLLPHSSTGFLGTANCDDEAGRPKEDAIVLTNVYFNTDPCPEVGTQDASWGAIKSLFE